MENLRKALDKIKEFDEIIANLKEKHDKIEGAMANTNSRLEKLSTQRASNDKATNITPNACDFSVGGNKPNNNIKYLHR